MLRISTALATAFACAALAATTHAAIGVGETTGVDTFATPTPKDPPAGLLRQEAGAIYNEASPASPSTNPKYPDGAPTSYSADLFDVAMHDAENGIAVGAECPVAAEHAKGCSEPTHPVAYSYSFKDKWQPVTEGLDGTGFIASVTWLDDDRALIVGATGRYPERETPGANCAANGDPATDPAGTGRVWIYESGRFTELTGADLPPNLRALHAVDAYDPKPGESVEFAVLGGLCQLWHWKDGALLRDEADADGDGDRDEFAQPYSDDADAPPATKRLAGLVYRVRSVRFADLAEWAPPISVSERRVEVFAATAGCCVADQVERLRPKPLLASLVLPSGGQHPALGSWKVEPSPPLTEVSTVSPPIRVEQPSEGRNSLTSPDSFVSVFATRMFNQYYSRYPVGEPPPTNLRKSTLSTALGPRAGTPADDLIEPGSGASAYPGPREVPLGVGGGAPQRTVTSSPGEQGVGSSSLRLYDGSGDVVGGSFASPLQLATARIDTYFFGGTEERFEVGTNPSYQQNLGSNAPSVQESYYPVESAPDGLADWFVGELSSRRGALYTTRSDLASPSTVADPPSAGMCGHQQDNSVAGLTAWFRPLIFGDTEGFHNQTQSWAECTVARQTDYPGTAATTYNVPKDPQSNVNRVEPSTRSYRLLQTPTYALNAIEMLDADEVGWAVGDHGAIVRLGTEDLAKRSGGGGGSSDAGSERKLPTATPPARDRWPDAGSDGSVPGGVPTLDIGDRGARTPVRRMTMVAQLRATPKQIVMSKDGTEGWAFGPRPYHFDGARWRDCEVETEHAPCASYTALGPVTNATRVPMEADADPTNDHEFELAALTGRPITDSTAPGAIARYRDGSWRIEQRDESIRAAVKTRNGPGGGSGAFFAEPFGIAFLAPDEGWAVARNLPGLNAFTTFQWFRFDGERWHACLKKIGYGHDPSDGTTWEDACDPALRLPLTACRSSQSTSPAFPMGTIAGIEATGDRLYAYGLRSPQTGTPPPQACNTGGELPFIAFRERGASGWNPEPANGEYDPGFSASGGPPVPMPGIATLQSNRITSFAVASGPDGRYEGWATGSFGWGKSVGLSQLREAHVLRLDSSGRVAPFRDSGGLSQLGLTAGTTRQLIALDTTPDGEIHTYVGVGGAPIYGGPVGNLYEFNPAVERFGAVPSGRPIQNTGMPLPSGRLTAIAPDGEGGAWVAVEKGLPNAKAGAFLYRYTDRPPKEIFAEVPLPGALPLEVRQIATAPDGTVWASTNSGYLYRYDRRLGWDRVRIPTWDPEFATATFGPNDIAIGPDGTGLAVGDGGKLASFSDSAVQIERASQRPCAKGLAPPCTSQANLLSVAVGAGGAALAGAQSGELLWRPAGGEPRTIPGPDENNRTPEVLALAGDSLVWVRANRVLYLGRRSGESWIWTPESDPLLVTHAAKLNAFALDSAGNGYAVGDGGLVLERRASAADPAVASWHELEAETADQLTTVTLVEGEPGLAIAGGEKGLILTRTASGFAVARPADFKDPSDQDDKAIGGPVRAVTLARTPAGGVEAWALRWESGFQLNVGQLLHFPGEGSGALAPPAARANPQPDAPAPREGEVTFAAFGKSGCRMIDAAPCMNENAGMNGSNEYAEVISYRIAEELKQESESRGGELFSLFTGDAIDSGGYLGEEALESTGTNVLGDLGQLALIPANGPRKLRRFGEQVPDRMLGMGIPVFGAIGGKDMPTPGYCSLESDGCHSTKEYVNAGDNLAWRQAMRSRQAPWGELKPQGSTGAYRYLDPRDPLGVTAVELPDPEPSDGSVAPRMRIAAGGGRTHYAVDVVPQDGSRSEAVARVIVLDSSLRSLAAADPVQQPVEARGQAAWLEAMLCVDDDPAARARGCTRRPGQRTIVLSNAPTYSYGPGQQETAIDGVALESILHKGRADVFVSGRIGWNGLYWSSLPGVHHPCPGEPYPTEPPAGVQVCGHGPSGSVPSPEELLAEGLAQVPSGTGGLTDELPMGRPIPYVVASGGGGELIDEAGKAGEGFWNGYTLVRLDPSGDTRRTIVEQRPIYDWVGIEAQERVLRPGQKMTLRGFARSPVGIALNQFLKYNRGQSRRFRTDRIDSAAVTHRYDLLAADPERPWQPKRGEDDGYEALDASVATIDDQSGVIKVGKGNHPPTYAIGMLSVGRHVAVYPLLFEPRRTFKSVVVTQPRVTSLQARAGAALPPPPQAPPAGTAVQPLNLPPPPQTPPLPPIDVPQVNAPSPPVPPPPPVQQSPVPLDLSASAPGVTIAPQTTVIPPPAPPIQPAPPGGARREARQRQSATQSSGSDSNASNQASDSAGDLADSPRGANGAQMTRVDRARADGGSMTAYYGASVTLLALIAAAGWNYGRPGPRRRSPVEPAPARAWARRRF